MIDLHTHTTASDGTYSPEELVRAAKAAQLDALAITDHDTFAGYEEALPVAAEVGIELVCGIELSTKMPVPGRPHGKSVHLLGYFPVKPPAEEFSEWISSLQESRRDRNRRLAARLQELGLAITLEDVVAVGRSMTGRPSASRTGAATQAAPSSFSSTSDTKPVWRHSPSNLSIPGTDTQVFGVDAASGPSVRILRRTAGGMCAISARPHAVE